MLIDFVMPKYGLTMCEGTVVRWIRQEGDFVSEGELVLEIETEKAVVDVPSFVSAKIIKTVSPVGAVVPVGGVLAVLEVANSESLSVPVIAAPTLNPPLQSSESAVTSGAEHASSEDAVRESNVRVSPLARRVARELGVDLRKVAGTGSAGMIVESDVRAAASGAPTAVSLNAVPAYTPETLSGMRKAISVSMRQSVVEAPQVTLTRHTGVAGLSAIRDESSEEISATDVFIAAVVRALQQHPRLNAHLVGNELRIFNVINIAIAVALEEGLVTPVLPNLSGKSLRQIAVMRRQLVNDARNRRLSQSELEDATFTITNLGPFDIDIFTPILVLPQVAILGVGAVKARPSVIEGLVVPRQTCALSLTFDHRALDGAPAARFLMEIADLLDDPKRLKQELL